MCGKVGVMAIPPFNIDGVLPPYTAPNGPGAAPHSMSPYAATPTDVVLSLGTSETRRKILDGWLAHRKRMRDLGFHRGFQWLDGSFVEQKTPRDLDVVTFLGRPVGISAYELNDIWHENADVFSRREAKAQFNLDAFFVDLDGGGEGIVEATRYYNGLFSHRRGDDLWKGMVRVNLGSGMDDLDAVEILRSSIATTHLDAGVQ